MTTTRNRVWAFVCFALVLQIGPVAWAGISEPDHYFYGWARAGGDPLTDATVSLRREGCEGAELVQTEVGVDDPGDDYNYMLVVPVEQLTVLGEGAARGVARAGERAYVCVEYGRFGVVHRLEAAVVYIGGRGLAARVDLDVPPLPLGGEAPVPPDADADGIPDHRDPCFGVGDSCAFTVGAAAERTVAVTDPDNPPDGEGEDALGAVDYDFSIAENEVTNLEYALFLRAVASVSDRLGLYSEQMASDPQGGIVRTGVPGGYGYDVKPGMANKPVNFVSWLDAAAFSNWVHGGQPTGPVALETVLVGAFDLTGADPAVDATYDTSASWTLPLETEWYKAAYYDPDLDGSPYHVYPTGENSDPIRAISDSFGDVSNPGPGVANYDYGDGCDPEAQGNGRVTSVGSAGSASPSGAVDMAGNVAEWLADDSDEQGMRRTRGGSYLDCTGPLRAAEGGDVLREAIYEGPDVGFRVMSVPEPAASLSRAVAATAVAFVAAWRRRRLRFPR